MAAHCRQGLRRILFLQPSRTATLAKPAFFRYSSTLQDDFEKAKDRLNTLQDDPGNETKLKIYALFKQGTVGKCNAKEPGAFDFVGKAKWNAWNSLGDMSQDDAKKAYIQLVNDLAGPPAENDGEKEEASVASKESTFTEIAVSIENGVYTIKKNRPHKKNAITWKVTCIYEASSDSILTMMKDLGTESNFQASILKKIMNFAMYDEIVGALQEADQDNNVKCAVITGEGDFYCSGNDLGNFMNIPPEGPQKMARDGREVLYKYVNAYIDFSKPLIAAVNGPAVGIAVTVLGLCDLVYASDNATFHTPFMSLGQSPEGCSSVTFPRLMGYSKANEVLLMGRKITAVEACERGLVTDVFPESEFKREVGKRIAEMGTLPIKSLRYSKALIRGNDLLTFKEANEQECLRLEERWLSEECMTAIMNFMSKKK